MTTLAEKSNTPDFHSSETTSWVVVTGTCCQHLHGRLYCGIQSCNDKMQESEPIVVIGRLYEQEQHDVVPISQGEDGDQSE